MLLNCNEILKYINFDHEVMNLLRHNQKLQWFTEFELVFKYD